MNLLAINESFLRCQIILHCLRESRNISLFWGGGGGGGCKNIEKPFFLSFCSLSIFLIAGCRRLKYIKPADNRRLVGHVILNLFIGIHVSCRHFCAMEKDCLSINIGPVFNDTVVCELNDADALSNPGDLKVIPGWTYRGTEVRK